LLEGAKHGEHSLYVTLSETQRELRLVAKRHGWKLEGATIFELIPPEISLDPSQELTLLHPAEMELGETTRLIFEKVEALQPSRIGSLSTAFQSFAFLHKVHCVIAVKFWPSSTSSPAENRPLSC
jgi:KaiC/GvpD/RAD55 family RecA-like ATPase